MRRADQGASVMRAFMRWTGRVRAVRFWVLLLLSLGASVVAMGDADAACTNQGGAFTGYSCQWKDEAYSLAAAGVGNTGQDASAWCIAKNGQYGVTTGEVLDPMLNGSTTWNSRAKCVKADGTIYSFGSVMFTATFSSAGCPVDKPWNETFKTCGDPQCPPGGLAGVTTSTNLGAMTCNSSGCVVTAALQPEGQPFAGYVTFVNTGNVCVEDNWSCPAGFNELNGVCYPPPGDCPAGTEKDVVSGQCIGPDKCPAGMSKNPATGACEPKKEECPAGQTKAPDGSCIENTCPPGQAKGSDGSCKPDSDGDGEPDEGKDTGTFSGGDDCRVPPLCAGDNIMCGQARIQWRIDCNTRKNRSIDGGQCGSIPVCTGEKCDALEYAQLLMSYRTACALEQMNGTGTGGSGTPDTCAEGDADCNGLHDAYEQVTEGGIGGTQDGVFEDNGDAGWAKVDRNGWLGGGSCPGLPVFEMFGKTFDLSAEPCRQGEMLGDLFVMAALMAAAVIIGRAAAGG